MNITKVALLHLEPRLGEVEQNRLLIEKAIRQAAAGGANWIVTPEFCLCGYYFAEEIGTDWISPQPDDWMKRLLKLAKEKDLTIFLHSPERDEASDLLYNSCFVLGPDGKIAGRHRKHDVSPKMKAESWASPGSACTPVCLDGVKVGLLICADTWRPDAAASLRAAGAGLIISPAAWPPEPCGPEGCWEKRTAETGVPMWVCNRTGRERTLDFTRADSVIAGGGRRLLEIALARAAILFFDWDMGDMTPISTEFKVEPLE